MAHERALLTFLLPLGLIILFLGAAIRILPEYQRGVVCFLGRFQAVKGPGLISIALIAGILILILPSLLNYIVAIYLIVIGVLGLFRL
jgi:regulator of protease activity HflC (stomatin/prohibitin superfamily)